MKESNLLITSIGKRVELIQHLRRKFKVVGADADSFNAARYFVDKFYKIPRIDSQYYIKVIIKICEVENIKVVIPLYENEFKILDSARNEFSKLGIILLLSSLPIINICKDKRQTYEYFLNTDVNVIKTYTDVEIQELLDFHNRLDKELFIKPVNGMGSVNSFKITSLEELKFFYSYVKNPIVQDFVHGDEYTVDCLVDLNGSPLYIVPRKRIEVRSGEVVKSEIVCDRAIINAAKRVIQLLKNNDAFKVIGPLTIQFFKENNKVTLIEINPRFGGGVPLSFESGADYCGEILKMTKGEKSEYTEEFKKVSMLRYSNAVYLRQ